MIAVLDASAAVKLVLDEHGSDLVRAIWDEPLRMVAPTVVLPEVAAAIGAARRAGRIDASGEQRAQRAWTALSAEIDLLSVDPELALAAQELAATRSVRGMDAIYLAVARWLAVPEHGEAVGLVSFDVRQRAVLRPADAVHLLPASVE